MSFQILLNRLKWTSITIIDVLKSINVLFGREMRVLKDPILLLVLDTRRKVRLDFLSRGLIL